MRKPLLAASIGVAFTLLAGIAVSAMVSLHSTEGSARRIVQASRFLAELQALMSRLRDAEAAQRAYVITGERIFLRPYRDASDLLPLLLGRMADIGDAQAQRRAQLQRLGELISSRYGALAEGVRLRERGLAREALQVLIGGKASRTGDALDDLVATITMDAEAELEEATRRWHRQSRITLTTVGAGSAMAMAFIILALVVLRRQFDARRAAQIEVQRLNSALKRQNDALGAVNQELESFSYSVSHDLRVPLRAIDGYARMLEEDIADRLETDDRRKITVIRDSTRKMGQLIDDLLSFSRLGRKPMEYATVDMTALAHECCGLLRQGAGSPLPDVEISELPAARGDRTLLRQLLLNLLSNAVKFSALRDRPHIEVRGRVEASECVYWVQDDGAGFDMQYVDKLFGVFQRLHGQHEFPGTGVGLAIVKRVATRHGGRVWAQGQVDQGATFYFALPRGEES